jgi:GNAT superfamily N-acetyltransferase
VAHVSFDISDEDPARTALPVPFLLLSNSSLPAAHACLDLLTPTSWGKINSSAVESNCVGELMFVIIDKDQRRKGLGLLLLQHIDTWAAAHSITHLALTCKKSLIPFYEKAGYIYFQQALETDHHDEALYWMGKKLSHGERCIFMEAPKNF